METGAEHADTDAHAARRPRGHVSYADLFWIFFKAGLAFGGGLGILAVLEVELVTRRRAVTKEEFLTLYGLGRIVPSGTMSALAVAYGYRFGGWPGTVVALTALVLPAFVLTVALTVAYGALQGSRALTLLPVTILPAALAFIAVAAVRLSRDSARHAGGLILALAAFGGAVFLHLNPAILLLAGGVAGLVVFAGEAQADSSGPPAPPDAAEPAATTTAAEARGEPGEAPREPGAAPP
jgi:chromate transporter